MAKSLRDQLLGSVIGECRIDEAIGGGAMGFVFKAQHLGLDKAVALKVLMPELRASHEFRERFEREARIAASVEHPNITPIYGTGITGEYQYIIMQYIEGVALSRVLSRQGMDPLLVLRCGEQIAAALAAVHRHAIVHRDVKPENVILARSGQVFLGDFGVACAFGESSPPGRGGSPAYMSPEQCRGEPLDGRSDLYSLGVMLYVMLSGRRPFLGSTTASLMLMHQQDAFPPLRTLRPETPLRFADCVERLLAKHPAQRPAQAQDLMRELQAIHESMRDARRRGTLSIARKSGDTQSRPSSFAADEVLDAAATKADGNHRTGTGVGIEPSFGLWQTIRGVDGFPGDLEEREELEEDLEGVELGLLSLGAEGGEVAESGSGLNSPSSAAMHPHSRRHAAALMRLHKALGENPSDPGLHRALGAVYRRARDYATAEVHYRQALELGGEERTSLAALGSLLRAQGRLSEAEQVLKRAIALDGGAVEARIALGKVYERAKTSGLARKQYQGALDAVPADERGYVALAALYISEGKHTAAQPLLETARELNPTFGPTLFWLAVVRARAGSTDEALGLLERAVKAGLRDRRRIVGLEEFSGLREHWRFRAILDALGKGY